MLKFYQPIVLCLSCIALLISGCATHIKHQTVFLSDVFELKRFAGGVGLWKWERDDIYAHEANGDPQYVGTVGAGSSYFIRSIDAGGLEHRVLAVSKDGLSIVFAHWLLYAPSKSNLEGGIHSYRYGEELKKVSSKKSMNTAHWALWPKPLPKNILPFSYSPSTYTPDDMEWAIRADDLYQFPLALLDAKPMHQCAFDGDTPKCKALLKQGKDIDAKTYWDFTPLDIAIIRDHEDTANFLLENGANQNTGVYPAFHRAVMLGRMRVVTAMLTRGIDVNKPDNNGNTPLHLAIYAGKNLVGNIGKFFDGTGTPRSIFDKKITTSLVRLLLEHGADPNIRDKSGKLPVELTHKYTRQETRNLLLQSMENKHK